MKKILTVTFNPCIDKTITIEEFNYGGLNRVANSRTDIGGKGINVSKVLKSFEVPQTAYAITAGENGKRIKEFLKGENIDSVFTETDGEVRINQKLINKKDLVTTEINEKGFCLTEEKYIEVLNTVDSLLSRCKIAVLSGSVPEGAPEGVYADVINMAKKYGVKVILDADSRKLELGTEALPYAIKPNLDEFCALIGKKVASANEIVSEAKKLTQKGIELVAVSMGADGAVFVTKDSAYKADPFAIECKSTVGAGDSMVAAMAYSLHSGLPLCDTAKLCVAAGSITSSKEGTQVCTFDEVIGRKDDVKVFVL